MIAILAALWPLFAYVGVGVALRRLHLPGEAFWPGAERLCFFLLMPALIFHSVAVADFGHVGRSLLVLVTSVGLMTLLCFLCWKTVLRDLSGAAFTSLFQGGVRFNTYVGISAAAVLYGQDGLAQGAVVLSILIPLVNVMSILLLAHYGDGDHERSLRRHWRTLGTNPIILSCLLGMAWNLTGLPIPPGLERLLKQLGDSGIVLGLLAVGAALNAGHLKARSGLIAFTTVLKLGVFPLVMMGCCLFYGAEGLAARVLMLFSALPTAGMAYIMARRMGGDADLIAGILLLETALASVTMPLVVSWAERVF